MLCISGSLSYPIFRTPRQKRQLARQAHKPYGAVATGGNQTGKARASGEWFVQEQLIATELLCFCTNAPGTGNTCKYSLS